MCTQTSHGLYTTFVVVPPIAPFLSHLSYLRDRIVALWGRKRQGRGGRGSST